MATVFVMMSGGVDSSVAASVLHDQGYDVVGVFMKCWSIEALTSMGVDQSLYGCFWEDDVRDARAVADQIGIPFYVWDFQDQYKQGVVDYMIREYQQGRTPNPDVMCNSVIKFGIFFDQAMQLGADYVATGHYARIGVNNRNEVAIKRGLDSNKDQTYFIWRILPQYLQSILFPIGEFESKQALREYALEKKLITSTKKDSQGLCFIGDTSLRELLIHTLGTQKGNIVTQNGEIVGSHPGAFLYTIGQREKLGLAGGPWYVSRIDINSNQIEIVHGDHITQLDGAGFEASDIQFFDNTIMSDLEKAELNCTCQIRYRQQAVKCKVKWLPNYEGKKVKVQLDEPIRAINKGQSVVFYDGEIMLGGGIID